MRGQPPRLAKALRECQPAILVACAHGVDAWRSTGVPLRIVGDGEGVLWWRALELRGHPSCTKKRRNRRRSLTLHLPFRQFVEPQKVSKRPYDVFPDAPKPMPPHGLNGRLVHAGRSGPREFERYQPPAACVPPSVGMVRPVTKAERSEAKNSKTRA